MKKSIALSLFVLSILIFGSSTLMPPPPENMYFYGVFPSSAPGIGGSYSLEEVCPGIDIASPLRVIDFPNSEDDLLLSKTGLVYKVNFEEERKEIVLDIKDRTFKLGEGGSVGMVLHPNFGNGVPDNQYILMFYRTKPDPDEWSKKGFNRLSKFYWNESEGKFDSESEEILFQQYDRTEWHNGGGMFFGRDGFLYLSLGDEGHEDFIIDSTQKLNGGFFSGVLRIDVDNDPSKSHPIIRQPLPNDVAPDGWGETYSQGYGIPNDNPWISDDGSQLEEFWAIGTRSPYSMYLDEETDEIWIADVGESDREEISKVEKGDNLQWPYREGTSVHEGFEKPSNLIGNERVPVFEYSRTDGTCIIGGSIYRGERHLDLFDRYVYADYSHNKIVSINSIEGEDPNPQTIIGDIKSFGLDLPTKSGITGLQIRDNGEILIFITDTDDWSAPGRILKLVQNSPVEDPPSKLSELGVFNDLETLEVKSDFIPYTVNSPLWSDRAEKERWMLVPSDGNRNTVEEQISFTRNNGWTFPKGTVFIKQFSLPLSLDNPDELYKLETRFFVIGEEGKGYGITYKWDEDQMDATLLKWSDSKLFDITVDGDVAYTQEWSYPSRSQCLTCHNAGAGYVLGVNTHQLNIDAGNNNLITLLNDNNFFITDVAEPHTLPKSYGLFSNASLDAKIKSYLDSNCSSCHRPDGVPNVSMDLRLSNTHPTLFLDNPTESIASDEERMIVWPGDHHMSELWVRDASIEEDRMPPLGRNLIDQPYIDSLALWIDNLEPLEIESTTFTLYPNPVVDKVFIHVNPTWEAPYTLTIYDMKGQLIFEKYLRFQNEQVNLSKFASGQYLIRIESGEKSDVKQVLVF